MDSRKSQGYFFSCSHYGETSPVRDAFWETGLEGILQSYDFLPAGPM